MKKKKVKGTAITNTSLCFKAEARLHVTKHLVEPVFSNSAWDTYAVRQHTRSGTCLQTSFLELFRLCQISRGHVAFVVASIKSLGCTWKPHLCVAVTCGLSHAWKSVLETHWTCFLAGSFQLFHDRASYVKLIAMSVVSLAETCSVVPASPINDPAFAWFASCRLFRIAVFRRSDWPLCGSTNALFEEGLATMCWLFCEISHTDSSFSFASWQILMLEQWAQTTDVSVHWDWRVSTLSGLLR